MASQLQHLRSSTANKRPTASGLIDGRIAINTASGSPGLFFKDNAGTVIKVGPVHVGSGAPNASPASGGSSGNSIGEQWLDNSGGNYVFKIWDGSAWRSETGEFVNASGDTMTGDLVMNNANIVFEGSTEDGFETTLTVVDPTADRTITLPNVTGTVVTTGDSGTVTSTMIADGTIVNADINSSAEIAVSKLADGTARQLLQTDAAGTGVEWTSNVDIPGTLDVTGATTLDSTLGVTGLISADGKVSFPLGTDAAPSLYPGSDTDTGIYSPDADQLALATNGTERVEFGTSEVVFNDGGESYDFRIEGDTEANLFFVDASADAVGVGTSSPSADLYVKQSGTEITAATQTVAVFQRSSTTGHSAKIAIIAGNAASSDIHFGDTDDEDAGILQYNHTNNNFNFNQALGISTTNPLNKAVISDGSNNNFEFSPGSTNTLLSYDRGSTAYLPIRTRALSHSFANGTTDFATIDSSGRLLVGTSSASLTNKFLLQGDTSSANNGGYMRLQTANSINAGTSLGSIGFGDAANNGALIEAKGDVSWSPFTKGSRLEFSTTADGDSSPTERMSIDNAGYIFPDTTSRAASGSIQATGAPGFRIVSANTTSAVRCECFTNATTLKYAIAFSNPNGIVGSISTNGSATAYNTSSDYRLKENVTSVTDGITRLQQLKPSRFNFIADPAKTVDGFLAHEVQTIVPEAITGEKDAVDDEGNPLYQGIDQSKLVPLLTAALQEALQKIEVLEQRLTDAGIA